MSDCAGAGCSGATLLSPLALLSGVFVFGVVGADGAGAFPPSFCSVAGVCGSVTGVSGSG